MELPIQITMRGMRHSGAVETAIRKKAAKLEKFHPRIVSCRVVMEQLARHMRRGRQFVVRIDLKVARREFAINNGHDKDPLIALRDAFDAARRVLEDHARRLRVDGKDKRASRREPAAPARTAAG